MNYTIYFSLCSLFYIIMLLIVIKKQNIVKNDSNNIFKALAVTNLIALIIEIICTISAMNTRANTFFLEIIVRLFLISLLAWIILFTIYIFVVLGDDSKKNSKTNKTKKRIYSIATLLFIISSIIVIILPVNYNFKKIYSYGPAISYVNYFSDIILALGLIYMFRHYNKTNSNKCTPFFAFIAGGVAMSIIQSYDPSLLLANTIETFVTYMIYFTLEKSNISSSIKEVNNARERK